VIFEWGWLVPLAFALGIQFERWRARRQRKRADANALKIVNAMELVKEPKR
jgi:hypothetical protein